MSRKSRYRPSRAIPHDAYVSGFFFCSALDPKARDDWADHMVALLHPAGELVTLIFPIVEKVQKKLGSYNYSMPHLSLLSMVCVCRRVSHFFRVRKVIISKGFPKGW